MNDNNQGFPPPTPGYQDGTTQTAGQQYGQPYGQPYGQQTYQQYQQQGYPDFTGQGGPDGSLVVNNFAREHLRSIGGWTKFISVASVIGITLGIIMIIFMMTVMKRAPYNYGFGGSNSAEGVMTVVFIVYIVILAIFYLPGFWGISAGSKMKKAALFGDQNDLEEGFRKWKYVCTFIGVITIIYCVFMVLGVIGFILGMTVMP